MRKGRTVKHCHGKDKGKPIKTHKTVAEAKKHHAAIVSSEKRRGKK